MQVFSEEIVIVNKVYNKYFYFNWILMYIKFLYMKDLIRKIS